MVGGRNTKYSIRRRLVAVFAILGTFMGPVALQGADDATIQLEPDRVLRGQRCTIRIRTTIPWSDSVEILRPDLEGPMVWWSYPYARPWTLETADGSSARFIEVLAALRIDAPGFHSIGPFQIRSGDWDAATEPKTVIGLETDESGFSYPIETGWRDLPESIWQGQSIPVILEARNLESLTLADSVFLDAAPRGLLEEAPGLGGIVTRPYEADILYDVPMASWIWTLNEAGTYVFPRVRTTVSGLQRSAPPLSITVKPVPIEILAYGAVGRFRLDMLVDEGPHRVGDIVSVRVRVEGEGNINVLRLPEPKLTMAQIVGGGSSSSYVPGPQGYEGWREERFDFQVERAGTQTLTLPQWSWLEPTALGRVRRTGVEGFTIDVHKAELESGTGSSGTLLGAQAFRYRPSRIHGGSWYWYFLIIPGFIVLVIVFFRRGSWFKPLGAALVLSLLISSSNVNLESAEEAAQAVALAMEGRWFEAEDIYKSLIDRYGELPGLLHDMAFIALETGRPDQAVWFLRRAMDLRPGTPYFAAGLEILEDRLGLTDQVPVPYPWSPFLVFLIWVFAMNLFFVSLAVLLRRRDFRVVILFIMSLIVLGISISILVYTGSRWEKSTAVVVESSRALRKIPGPLGNDWIQLPGGTAVQVEARKGDDCLVKTGYGLDGWLPVSSLMFVREMEDGL